MAAGDDRPARTEGKPSFMGDADQDDEPDDEDDDDDDTDCRGHHKHYPSESYICRRGVLDDVLTK